MHTTMYLTYGQWSRLWVGWTLDTQDTRTPHNVSDLPDLTPVGNMVVAILWLITSLPSVVSHAFQQSWKPFHWTVFSMFSKQPILQATLPIVNAPHNVSDLRSMVNVGHRCGLVGHWTPVDTSGHLSVGDMVLSIIWLIKSLSKVVSHAFQQLWKPFHQTMLSLFSKQPLLRATRFHSLIKGKYTYVTCELSSFL